MLPERLSPLDVVDEIALSIRRARAVSDLVSAYGASQGLLPDLTGRALTGAMETVRKELDYIDELVSRRLDIVGRLHAPT